MLLALAVVFRLCAVLHQLHECPSASRLRCSGHALVMTGTLKRYEQLTRILLEEYEPHGRPVLRLQVRINSPSSPVKLIAMKRGATWRRHS
eukprot:scaffold296914_cov33-Tisochrysis_lutea.AAC.3